MAGDTIVRIQQIISDLRQSWYFRVWAFAWLVLALVTFSALIILSKDSSRAQNEEDIAFWVENATQITFPRFHLRMDHRGNEKFLTPPYCTYGANNLVGSPCQSFMGFQPPLNQCVAFNSNDYVALNDWTRGDSRIYCEATTTGSGYNGNLMMAFEFEGQNTFSFGAGAFMSTWFAPNDMTRIQLQKNVLQKTRNEPTVDLWATNLIYESTNFQPNLYNLTLIMQSFYVNYFQPRNNYNGWMAVGNIGGVGYFMVCVHVLFTIIIGFFLANTSNFLANSSQEK